MPTNPVRHKLSSFLLILLFIATLLIPASCQSQQAESETTTTDSTTAPQATATPAPTATPTPTPTPGPLNPLTGLELDDPQAQGQRPIALMINNIKVAVPQTGIGEADLMYEMLVEGDITRQMVVFADINDIPEIGSIRSARHDYIDLAGGLDAILVHIGASNLANDQFARQNTDHIDLHVFPDAYWRDQDWRHDRGYEHSVKTTGDMLTAALAESGDRTTLLENIQPAFSFRSMYEFAPATGESAISVSIPYSEDYCITTFDYDENTRLYSKGQYDAPQIDLSTGDTLTFTNIILIMTRVYVCDDLKHKEAELESGEGYYISGGRWQVITWEKGDTTDRLVLYDEQGSELQVNCGKSYIGIVPKSRTISFD